MLRTTAQIYYKYDRLRQLSTHIPTDPILSSLQHFLLLVKHYTLCLPFEFLIWDSHNVSSLDSGYIFVENYINDVVSFSGYYIHKDKMPIGPYHGR